MKIECDNLLNDLPGEELIRPGLDDFLAKRITVESLLVAIVSNRLRKYGILHCKDSELPAEAELQLYSILAKQYDDPYTQYRAYNGRMTKFENALDHRFSRQNKHTVA
jgi:hypothetical protein